MTLERQRLSETRQAITHKFKVGGKKGYLTVGFFEDGTPGEIFCKMDHDGSNTIGGLLSCLCIQTSMLLQYGIPLEVIVNKMAHQQFAPSGPTANKEIPFSTSVVDYVFRWLGFQYVPGYREKHEAPGPKK